MTIVYRLAAAAALAAGLWMPGASASTSSSLETIRHLAIQHRGRLKPVDSFARETLDVLTGTPRLEGEDPVVSILRIATSPSASVDEPLIAVPFAPLRERLGIPPGASLVSFNDLVSTRKLMRMLPPIVEKQERSETLTMLENETMDVYNRFVTIDSLLKQEFHLTPAEGRIERRWQPILESPARDTWVSLVAAFQTNDAAGLDAASARLAEEVRQVNPDRYPAAWRLDAEVRYNRLAPFAVATIIYFLAALLGLAGLLTSRPGVRTAGLAVLVAGFLVHGAGIAARVVLGGRPPVSNFYETMLWIPFVAVALSLVFERIYRTTFFGLAAAILAGITLFLADLVPLDSSIGPVVAVLNNNLWLTIHVLTIVGSYGALGLATVMAHLYAAGYLIRGSQHPSLISLGTFLYRTIQVGVVLLAAGTMLGAVWANVSWGRYWAWDPKETWALITLLWFLAALHGRFAGWLKPIGMALSTIAGFFLLLMTYYGVSFFLAGLHSYAGGHAKPIPTLLTAYVIAELAFMALIGFVAMGRRRLA